MCHGPSFHAKSIAKASDNPHLESLAQFSVYVHRRTDDRYASSSKCLHACTLSICGHLRNLRLTSHLDCFTRVALSLLGPESSTFCGLCVKNSGESAVSVKDHAQSLLMHAGSLTALADHCYI